ncbi:per1-like family domain-containing protein [Phthorimaea operculella]|nr:per1-like family domain-containing protein [Phthorimaea operculella]
MPNALKDWPFVRILGLQEPVSVLGSLLNLATNVYMYRKLIKDKRFTLQNSPMLYLWHIYSIVCINTWIWSTLFHVRDTLFTEFMDYAGALSHVVIHFIAAVVRLLYRKPRVAGLIILCTLFYFIDHCRYLYQGLMYQGRIDYAYNMVVNVITGMAAIALFMLFSLGALCGAGGGGTKGQLARRYVWRLVVFCKLTGATVLLELFDFPPYMRHFDAHALWHLSTAPLPLLFYGFIIEDLDYLLNARNIDTKTDTKLA